MTNAYRAPKLAVGSLEDSLKQICFFILEIPSKSIAAKIGYLHHAREVAVDEKRSFNYMRHIRPKSPAAMKLPHQFGVFPVNGFIVIVNQKAVDFISIRDTFKKLFKSRNNLLKCLFCNCPCRTGRIKMSFVHAFREKSGISPARNNIRHLLHQFSSLGEREVRIFS